MNAIESSFVWRYIENTYQFYLRAFERPLDVESDEGKSLHRYSSPVLYTFPSFILKGQLSPPPPSECTYSSCPGDLFCSRAHFRKFKVNSHICVLNGNQHCSPAFFFHSRQTLHVSRGWGEGLVGTPLSLSHRHHHLFCQTELPEGARFKARTHITRAPISPLFNPFSTLALNNSFCGFFVLEVAKEREGEEVTRMVCLNVKLNG